MVVDEKFAGKLNNPEFKFWCLIGVSEMKKAILYISYILSSVNH